MLLIALVSVGGRPAPPKQVHRSAMPGLVFLAISFLLLGYSGSQDSSGHSVGQQELVLGLAALIPAVVLLAPFCLSTLAWLGRRTPIAVRLALRDLDRYRARSGSALAAIGLGVLIAVTVAILAAARYSNVLDYAGPNLASDQLIVYTPSGPGYAAPGLGPAGSAKMRNGARDIASSVGAHEVVELVALSNGCSLWR
jgi:putative ABC transport system permease protein